MIVTCWSVKGGSGTSVVAAALAVAWSRHGPVLALDLAGDLPAVLGTPVPGGPGVAEWLEAGPGVGGGALLPLAAEVQPGLRLLPLGDGEVGAGAVAERWHELVETVRDAAADVVIDAGSAPLPPGLGDAGASLLVVRPCFLALRRAGLVADRADGVVLVSEPGRALGRRDVERVAGVRVVAEVPLDPAVARAVDAGLLAGRLPGALGRLAGTVQRWARGPGAAATTVAGSVVTGPSQPAGAP